MCAKRNKVFRRRIKCQTTGEAKKLNKGFFHIYIKQNDDQTNNINECTLAI